MAMTETETKKETGTPPYWVSRMFSDIYDINDDPAGQHALEACAVSKMLEANSSLGAPLVALPNMLQEPCRTDYLTNMLSTFKNVGMVRHNEQYVAQMPEDYVAPLAALFADGVHRELGVELVSNGVGRYIHYRGTGAHHFIHVDNPSFGDATALVVLDYVPPTEPNTGSPTETRFVTSSGVQSFRSEPGNAVVFDGRYLPHGRTPLCEGETVTIALLGMMRK
ncbi:hypothetical protein ACFWPX_29755 [Nocardia sp. NPDC058518]|uniref:hypothetical protein n=1 Tax=Nocardia sp. NPDC058518 TaxID=3346534 RepID=UPI00364F8D73